MLDPQMHFAGAILSPSRSSRRRRPMSAERDQNQHDQAEHDHTEDNDVLADAVEAGPTEEDTLDVDDVMPPASAGALAPLRDPVGRFLAEARRFPRLTDEEERKLGKA